MHAKQSRQRESIDVGINGGRIITERRESGGKIRGDGRFADTALAAHYGNDLFYFGKLIGCFLLNAASACTVGRAGGAVMIAFGHYFSPFIL